MTYLNTRGFHYDADKQLFFDKDLVQRVSYAWNMVDDSGSKIVLTNYANQQFFVTPEEFVNNFVKIDNYLVTKELNLKFFKDSAEYVLVEPRQSTTVIATDESLVLLHVTYLGQLVFYYKPLGHVTLSHEEANLHLSIKKA